MKILVIDDEKDVVKFLVKLLKIKGFKDVRFAENGKEGLKKYYDYKPDLILTDINMPEMDGLELLKNIKAENPDTIVIILSGIGSSENVIKALELHADNFLKKPFSSKQLVQLLLKYSEIIKDRVRHVNIEKRIISSEYKIEFENDISKIGDLTNLLVRQCGNSLNCEEKHKIKLGLYELIMNAVEHGNLGISYEEKGQILEDDGENMVKFYKQRMSDPEHKQKKVYIKVYMDTEILEWTITDEGKGFDWNNIKSPLQNSKLDLHGRGIFLAGFQFDTMEYFGNGNIVQVTKKILKPDTN
ncbi:response regulator [bacterium]|nr:response regulator [bacterium]